MTRILFVDDEPRILDGLRQSLRARRKVWDMVFAPSGAAALKELESKHFDAIVSDMRMPGMDGAELLARAADMCPQAVRIVLSGHMDETAASRAAQVAHRFLSKPCEPASLEATIVRTLELRLLLTSQTIRSCVIGMGTLPSPPRACLALNQALDQEAPMDVVARIIESDVAMATKVLQLVNSSFFGMPRTIASVAHAVSYLGLNTMRNLVLAQSMFHAFSGEDVAALEREQAHALSCARIARSLLEDKKQAELANTAALLHDVGTLALRSRLGSDYKEVRELAAKTQIPLQLAERMRFRTSHAAVGAYLLGLWGLPFDVMDAVAHHHEDWDSVVCLDVNSAVRIAVSHACTLSFEPDEARLHGEPAPAALIEKLGISTQLTKATEEFRRKTAPKTGEAS